MRVKQSHLFGSLAMVEVGLHGRDWTLMYSSSGMVTPLPAWSVFDEMNHLGPRDVSPCGVNSVVKCAPAFSSEFTHSQEPEKPKGQGVMSLTGVRVQQPQHLLPC